MSGRTPGREPAGSTAAAASDVDVAEDELEVSGEDEELVEDPAVMAAAEKAADKDAVEAAIRALWQEFKGSADPRLRKRLTLHYSPLVKYVAGRVGVGLPPNIEQADLVSYGIFGLIDAIEKFDIS